MRSRRHLVRPKGLLVELFERAVVRGQTLISAGERFPLILATYPRGRSWFADSLREALRFTFPALPAALRAEYDPTLERLPNLLVADLRRRNACACLGHHHQPPSDGPLARRLAADTGGRVGEIDLAIEAIRDWAPLTLSSMAAQQLIPPVDAESQETYARLCFHSGLLSVFLHELEHMAFPQRDEEPIRRRSDALYQQALGYLLAEEFGASFGISV